MATIRFNAAANDYEVFDNAFGVVATAATREQAAEKLRAYNAARHDEPEGGN